MAKILLSLHVLAAILAIGPVAVAASVFPRYLRLAAAADPAEDSAVGVARALHRICRVYALLGIAVPFFGLATAGPLHVFGDAWVIISIVLTAAAAALLAAVILPGQRRALAALAAAPAGAAGAVPSGTEAADTDRRSVESATVAAATGSATTVVVAAPAVATPAATTAGRQSSPARAAARLAMTTGIFNLLWAAVVVLMIVRPGSTTGV